MVNTSQANQKFPYILLVAFRRVSCALVVGLSFWGVGMAYGVNWSDLYTAVLIISVLLALMLFHGGRRETDGMPLQVWNVAVITVGRWGLLIAILLLLGYATKTSSVFSRKALFTWFIVTPPLLLATQVLVDMLVARTMMSARNTRRVVIAGAADLGHKLAAKIQSNPQMSMSLEGFFDDRSPDRLSNGETVALLGKLGDLPDYVRQHQIDLIFVALPMRNIQRVMELMNSLQDTTASIYFVPDVFVFDLIQCRTSDLDGLPIVALCETPFQGSQGLVKALSDYTIASLVLLLSSPIMISIALAIKLTSKGSVIFKQRRYGLDGREIIVYKFRTMTVSDDGDVVKQATRDDARITRVGAILRKYSLDELPQFINVLQGRMSVVGPRPHAVAHNEAYRPLIKGYMMRHKVNPGITGLAQVLGYRGETKTLDAMEKRVEYDLEYLRNWSLSLDIRIILRTLRIVASDKMAY